MLIHSSNIYLFKLGECNVVSLHLEGDEVTEVRLRYAGFREGDQVDSCFAYLI